MQANVLTRNDLRVENARYSILAISLVNELAGESHQTERHECNGRDARKGGFSILQDHKRAQRDQQHDADFRKLRLE